MRSFELLFEYRWALLKGFSVTLQLFGLSLITGSLLGAGIGLAVGRSDWSNRIWSACSTVASAIPALVLLFWIHYPLQESLGLSIDPFYSATVALTFLNTVAVANVIKESLEKFPTHFLDAALVCGMSPGSILRTIKVPLLLRSILPRWLDQQIVLFHCTVFASLISVEELFRVAQRVNSVVYQPIAVYTIVALVFILVVTPVLLVARKLHRAYVRDFSER